jgi:Tol biopolymer transport system component
MKLTTLFGIALTPCAALAAFQSQPQSGPALAAEVVAASISGTNVPGGGALGNSWSGGAALSATGRFVAFHSYSTNLVAGDTNVHYDVFVRDRVAGSTERVSVNSAGQQAAGSSIYPSISADGRWVAFVSYAANLAAGDSAAWSDIFVHDRVSGETRLVSRSSSGVIGNHDSRYPSISANGRFVAFESLATNLAADPNGIGMDVFVHDLWTGTTALVSVAMQGGGADDLSQRPSISGDGRLVAFHSRASNLVPGDTNDASDVFVRDLISGATLRVSVHSSGAQSSTYSADASISANGRYVAFESAERFVPADPNGFFDIYVHDLVTGDTSGVTPGVAGFISPASAGSPSISSDGRFVAYEIVHASYPAFETTHVFVHDRTANTTLRSSQRFGIPGDGDSTEAAISGNGLVVGFESRAANLVDGDANDSGDVFLHAPRLR